MNKLFDVLILLIVLFNEQKLFNNYLIIQK